MPPETKMATEVTLSPSDPVVQQFFALNEAQIIKYLRQFTKWRMKHPLTLEDFRWIRYVLRSALTTSTTSAQITHSAPSNYATLLFSIQGHMAFNALSGESLAVATIGNPGLKDRVLMKAMNVRLALQNKDRGFKIFETNDLPLSSILPAADGKPWVMNPPYILDESERLQLDISLSSTASDVIGNSTDVGIELLALLVRRSP